MREGVLALLVAAAACGRRPAPPCPTEPGFDRAKAFKVVVERRPETVRRERTLAELARLSPKVGRGKLQGLASVDHRFAVSTRLGSSGDSPACVWLEQLTVDLTPAAVDVVVPGDFPPGSCEYETVLEHERSHVALHDALLQKAAASLREALAKAAWLPTRANPSTFADRSAAEQELADRVGKVLRPPYEEFRRELERRDAELDGKPWAEARRRCRGWR